MSGDDLTDAELLSRAVSDDEAALALILRRYATAVTRYAWALVGNQADVEEVVQDTFLTFWRKAESILLPDHSLLPWLLVTCRNLSMNLNRSRFRYSTDQLSDDLLASYLGPFVPDQGKGLERFLTASSAAELIAVEPLLAGLHAPAQVAWGTADSFFEPSWADRLAAMIPGVERVILVPDAMLFWPDERAADLVPLLRDFWESHA